MSKHTNGEIAGDEALWDEFYNTQGFMPYATSTYAERVEALQSDYPADDEIPLLEVKKAAGVMGRKGGKATTEAKKTASKANGAKGGRPPKKTRS